MVAAVISAIASTLQAVTQLKRVYDHVPSSVQTADLPCAYIVQGAAAITQHASGWRRQERTYTVVLVIEPSGQERWQAKFANAVSVYEAVMNALTNDWSLNNTVDHIERITDAGVQVVTVAGVEHLGYEIQVTTVLKP